MKSKEAYISELNLEPHPEGGFYLRTEASEDTIKVNQNERKLYTSIYFLLTEESPSHFHQLTADEIWYYHDGNPLTVHCIFPDGRYEAVKVGKNTEEGERLHYLVPKGTIFGSTVSDDYSLVSCVVVPGFEFTDFRLFTQKELLDKYPKHEEIIKKLAFEEI
ncbi:cupin domain-containing protein [Vagococcus hydrophili]|uniref:Cupin domain-containing protein n=1 Tax=Vagococcus hydrophili TaxID=2714947 RepID=A0A6G8AV80_9ENTE|nr:cupin domain-containing protein [Vagococcus hydrophili]QIL48897.1 cupin domain-containing protein [Vagococcus hydrophili]